jgi:hypothetical protein
VKTRIIARALNEARADFDRRIAQVADLAREQLVPYFQKRGWSYMTGNGSWLIKDRRGRTIEDHKLPTAVRDVLYLEVEHDQLLGFFINDIAKLQQG